MSDRSPKPTTIAMRRRRLDLSPEKPTRTGEIGVVSHGLQFSDVVASESANALLSSLLSNVNSYLQSTGR